MTGPPRNATVLNTTVLSNFAQVDHVELLLDVPRIATVDAVKHELEDGHLKRWIDEAGFRSPVRDFEVFLEG
jgi:hypothetical protein